MRISHPSSFFCMSITRQSMKSLFVSFLPFFLSPGQQLGQSCALHLGVQHPQRPTAVVADPDPLSPSHLLFSARVSHPPLRRRRRGWTRQPRDHEAGQAHLGDSRGGRRREAERGRKTPVPTSTLPLRAVPGLPRGRPQPRPLRPHGDVDLRGGCGLQPGTLKHHQLGPPALADWLAGPQRTFSEASGADSLCCGLWSSQRHRRGRQVLGTAGTAWGRRGNPREVLEDSARQSRLMWLFLHQCFEAMSSLDVVNAKCEPKTTKWKEQYFLKL